MLNINPTKPIFCGDLYSILSQHYLDLAKKKLTFYGAYISTTVSKSDKKNTKTIEELRKSLAEAQKYSFRAILNNRSNAHHP